MKNKIWNTAQPLIKKLATIDVRALAAFRISLGLIVLADLAMRLPLLWDFYTDSGALPRILVPETHRHIQEISLISGSAEYMLFLFGITAISATFLVCGYKTRLATIATLILIIAVQDRVPLMQFGADTQLRAMLFWSIFLPLGSVWSLDAKWKLPPKKMSYYTAASFALLFQISLIYLMVALFKDETWHTTATAVTDVLNAQQVTSSLAPLFQTVFYPVLPYLTLGIWWTQILTLPLVFFPFFTKHFRLLVFVLLSIFHIGLLATMRLDLFPLISLTGLLILVPDYCWNKLESVSAALKEALLGKTETRSKNVKSEPNVHTSKLHRYIFITAQIFVSLILCIVVSYNVNTYRYEAIQLPDVSWKVISELGLKQKWALFRKSPTRSDWVEISGYTHSGQLVDPYHQTDVFISGIPERGEDFFNHRMQTFFRNLRRHQDYNALRQKEYLYHLCRKWNHDRSSELQLESIRINYMDEVYGSVISRSYYCPTQ